jgi:hypothetical protein
MIGDAVFERLFEFTIYAFIGMGIVYAVMRMFIKPETFGKKR